MEKQKVLNVRNIAQRVLFETELSGQISDGYWENSGPFNHYQSWSSAIVQVDPYNVGRNFYASKDNYNFTNSDLIECVGDRMIYAVNVAIVMGEHAFFQMCDHMGSSLPNPEYYDGNGYFRERADLAAEHGMTKEVATAAMSGPYTRKNMMKDLKDLKVIVRTRSL